MEIKQLKLNGENIYPKVAIDSIVGEDGSSKVDTTVTENSDNLITSGAVYTEVQRNKPSFKTINNESITGTGNIAVQSVLVSGTNIKTINNQSILGSGNIEIGGGGVELNLPLSTINNINANPTEANKILVYDGSSWVYADKPGDGGQIQSDWDQTITTAVDFIKNKPDLSVYAKSANLSPVATSGSYTDLTGKPNLATVATSGSYTDLSNKPSFVAAVKALKADDDNSLDITGSGTVDVIGEGGIKTKNPSSNTFVIYTDGLQEQLVSGTNIKTINNQSILGSGNITISGSGSTGRQVLSYISSDSTIDQPPLYSLEIPFTDNAFTIKVTAVDCSPTGDRLTSTTNVYTVFAKRYDDFAIRIINRDGDNKDVIKTAKSLANSTVTYEGSYGTGNNKWYLPIQITSSVGLKAVMIEIIGATVNGASATIYDYPGSLTYPNTSWKNDELNNLMA